jgi:hypothetical protein
LAESDAASLDLGVGFTNHKGKVEQGADSSFGPARKVVVGKLLRAVVTEDRAFTVAFAGTSVTAGHDNWYDSDAAVFCRPMSWCRVRVCTPKYPPPPTAPRVLSLCCNAGSTSLMRTRTSARFGPRLPRRAGRSRCGTMRWAETRSRRRTFARWPSSTCAAIWTWCGVGVGVGGGGGYFLLFKRTKTRTKKTVYGSWRARSRLAPCAGFDSAL